MKVIETRNFFFKLPEEVFYDGQSYSPLVVYATDMADYPIPDWVQFNSDYRSFTGIAPKAGTIA